MRRLLAAFLPFLLCAIPACEDESTAPDPTIPGGILTRVLGSATLADPGWEGCAWPETFVPDRIPLLDTAPAGGVNQATFDGQTFRFGRPDAPDVVLAIATSQRRDYCPTPLR